MSVFVKCAFKEGEEKEYPKFLEIGEAIAIKCGGLPLAVKSLGSLLYTKKEESEWHYISDNDIWKIEQKENDVLPILKLSYDELPLHLKQCFAYCAKLPKDYMISNYDLIAQWMANDLIAQWKYLYLHELLSRSFFQDEEVFFPNALISVKMHDLVHDLALLVADKEVSHVKYDTRNIFEGTHHLLFSAVELEGKEFPESLLKLNKVRLFSFEFNVGPISKKFIDTLIKTFKCLLDLNGSEFEELPSSVSSLIHLRYLSVDENCKIKSLPNTICNLVNLQSLSFRGCVMLQDLPRDFGNLLNLRSLFLTSQMTCFTKKGISEGLISLQYLIIFSCQHLESLSEGLRNLTALRHLYITDCRSLTSLSAESMRYITSLETLVILTCEKLNLIEEDTLMELPSGFLSLALVEIPNLKELPRESKNVAVSIKYIRIENCPSFEILPEWLKKCTFLLILQILNCLLLECLPLGMHQLTGLRELQIVNCSDEFSRKCEMEIGEYWPWISHIPEVQLN